MATQLNLQDQEQLDTLKSFWKQYGNLITWSLILALGGFSAWNGWNWYQRDQGTKAGAMFDELDRAVAAGDADKAGRVFGDLKERFAKTAFAQQGGLAAAQVQFSKGQAEAARASLQWVADNAIEAEIGTVARLRLAGLQSEAGEHDAALATLAAAAPGFEGLVADRRGDVLAAQGKADEARAAYQAAYQALGETIDYRRVVEAKLTALGAPPAAPATPATPATSGAAS
jgi:predicted negative regulator of RcsB-dependent stress response